METNTNNDKNNNNVRRHERNTTATTTVVENNNNNNDSLFVLQQHQHHHHQQLYRNNIIQLEVDQLLEECRLCVRDNVHDVPWYAAAQRYVANVNTVLRTLPSHVNGNDSMNDENDDENENDDDTGTTTARRHCRAMPPRQLPLQSDKPPRSLSLISNSNSRRNNDNDDNDDDNKQSKSLVLQVHLSTSSTTMGFTTPIGNAKQLPIIECILPLPHSLFETKDYLQHRYFHKRNLLLWHVFQHLHHHSDEGIGTVQWYMLAGNDYLPVILLTPPPVVHKNKNKKKKKGKRPQQDASKKIMFQVQIQFQLASPSTDDDDDDDDGQQDRQQQQQWKIPQTRFFPNRSNLKCHVPYTPLYNTYLARDVVRGCITSTDRSNGKNNNNDDQQMDNDWEVLTSSSSLTDALILLKVWCLQRGLLGGHDSFHTCTDIAYSLLYLVRTRHITDRMMPIQIISAWWKFIITTSTSSSSSSKPTTTSSTPWAAVIPKANYTEEQTIRSCRQAQLYVQCREDGDPPTLLECFQICTPRHGGSGSELPGPPILLHPSMTYNVWAHLSPSFYRQLRAASEASLRCLHNDGTSYCLRPFSYLFLQQARFYSTMDAFVRIPLDVLLVDDDDDDDDDKNIVKYKDGGVFGGIARHVVHVLERALGDRVMAIRVLTSGNGRITETGDDDPSQIPKYGVVDYTAQSPNDDGDGSAILSPTGDDHLVVGLRLNSQTCHRIVDRGPPAEDVDATREFLQLWGKEKAQLRRFKDGAIVHAVVWNTVENEDKHCVVLEGDDKSQGGIVERIVRHILDLHFFRKRHTTFKPKFALRDMLSLVDGVACTTPNASSEHKFLSNATFAFKSAMNAFDSLSEFLRENSSPSIPIPGSADAKTSRLGVPLAIDAVEPLSPSLRYSELFPPIPHPTLGGPRMGGKKISGVAPPPILIQIRFGLSSKWPTDLKAIAAAKTAMLIQLADGIESMKQSSGFEGPILVTPSYMDLGYKGYAWRIMVRADPELNMLKKLQHPSPEAVSLLRTLTRDHVVSASHHSMIHAIHTLHPSSGSVVRLAKRWTATHLLSDLLPSEAIELLVAKVYTNQDSPLDCPTTVVAGFMRFLHLLASHNWTRHPLVVDPHGHMNEDDLSDIVVQFEHARGPDCKNGAPMYIVSPNDRVVEEDDEKGESGTTTTATKKGKDDKASKWMPTYTQHTPEWVVLSRATALAKRSYDFLMTALSSSGKRKVDWTTVFHETPLSFKSFSALLRIDTDFVVDKECSSTGSDLHIVVRNNDDKNNVLESSYTRSMRQRLFGPKALRRKVYRNLNSDDENAIMYDWRPVEEMVKTLREKFGPLALFFYNALSPEVVGVLWRPTSFTPRSFTVLHSDYVMPLERQDWTSDKSLVIRSTNDILREMMQYTTDLVVDIKVLDDRSVKVRRDVQVGMATAQTRKRRRRSSSSTDTSASSSDIDSDSD